MKSLVDRPQLLQLPKTSKNLSQPVALDPKNNEIIDEGLVQQGPNVQVGNVVRVRKNAVDLYFTCLAYNSTADELPNRSPNIICGPFEIYPTEQGGREGRLSCWYCGEEKRYRDPPCLEQWNENKKMFKQFLNTAKFTVKEIKENCCVLSPKLIHIAISDLELV